MEKILQRIDELLKNYYDYQLEVNFGYPDNDSVEEGYYISKLNDYGATPITEVICLEYEIDDSELINKLDELNIAYCF